MATATVGYVFSRVPLPEAWSAALDARIEILIPMILTAALFWFLLESYAYARLFSHFNTRISWREARSLRGLSYLLTPIHLSLGKVGVVLRLAALKNLPPLEIASTVALYQTIDSIVLAALATIGLSFVPTNPLTNETRAVAIALLVTLASYLVFLRLDCPRFGIARRLRNWTIHRTHRRVDARDLLFILGIKLAYHLTSVAVFYFGTRAFGVELPFWVALAATPIIQAIGAIPISPAGLGTQHAAMLFFFSAYGSDSAIVAFGFTSTVALVGVRCLLGLLYLPTLNLRGDESSEPGKGRARRFARPYFQEEIVSTSSGPVFP